MLVYVYFLELRNYNINFRVGQGVELFASEIL